MNTAEKVTQLMEEWKREGVVNTAFVVKLANACIGWSYVFGARGDYCIPSNRRSYYNSKKKESIKEKCKNFDGNVECSGCKWYPGGKTRFFDCRGFTYWLFMQIGIKIEGVGATSQYNKDSNWSEKGTIDKMPLNKVCCVFRWDDNKKTMEHTLLYDGEGHYIHCSGEVKKVSVNKYNATHYAIPKGLYSGESTIIPPVDTEVKLPTLRKGDKGPYVTLLQTQLLNRGYQLPKYGADGSFGNETLAAVKLFQQDWGLKVDGVVGKDTWQMLETSPERKLQYTVTIPHLSKEQGESLLKQYPGTMVLEE